ncbi:MAG: hypothetical protein HQL72_15150 [Magnetococcales bacterium]|nr:hypothetical protein [Magnetococcales bacterium]
MNIPSAAGFLINRAVKMAADLGREGKGSANRAAVPTIRSKAAAPTAEIGQRSRQNSSAYRVSLSSSALRKGAMESLSV